MTKHTSRFADDALSDFFRTSLREFQVALGLLEITCLSDVNLAVSVIGRCLANKGRILLCGNGGSAADTQHFAGELVATFRRGVRRPPLSVMSLANDISTITAYANDFQFEDVFARQVQAHGRADDCLICVSTSGSSENILRAAHSARNLGMVVIGITGTNGSKLSSLSDVLIQIPSDNTQIIQNSYQFLLHVLCFGIEEEMRLDKDGLH